MSKITSQHLDLYLDEFIATQPDLIACDFRTVLGLVCAFDDQAFLDEIIKGDEKMYKLYLDAEAYIQKRINSLI